MRGNWPSTEGKYFPSLPLHSLAVLLVFLFSAFESPRSHEVALIYHYTLLAPSIISAQSQYCPRYINVGMDALKA